MQQRQSMNEQRPWHVYYTAQLGSLAIDGAIIPDNYGRIDTRQLWLYNLEPITVIAIRDLQYAGRLGGDGT